MTLAERIQHLRKIKGISQEGLADKIGVSRQAVSKWESEQSTPDLDKIIALSEYFEVTTDYLLKGEASAGLPDKNAVRLLYVGFALVCATLAGIWSFTANRFRTDECFLIVLAGAAVGVGISLILQVASRLSKK